MAIEIAHLLLSLVVVVVVLQCHLQSVFCDDVKVTVKSATNIASTDDNFVCATLDWWPPQKCNYDQCPWGNTSIINLDLNNTILNKAVRAFNPLRIRIGGTLEDKVLYDVGHAIDNCPDFNTSNGLFGFTNGCLHRQRWDEVTNFMKNNKVLLTFGLNALIGRTKASNSDLYEGDWDGRNARDLIEYTYLIGYDVESWELGNELCGGGVGARVDAQQYGKDMIMLRAIVDSVYEDSTYKPKVLGPGGFFDKQWFDEFLQSSGPNIVDGVTHHIYNLGPGDAPDLLQKIQDPVYLSEVAQTFKDAQTSVSQYGPWSAPWIGESGGAYNSGGKYVSHTFVDSFWYLDQLGMTSTFDHKVYCRQSLIGGNYGLLNTTSFIPNPDYYSALLWHRLMGTGVLSTTHEGSPYLRTYSHCSKQKSGVTLLLINLSNSTSFNVTVENDMNLYPTNMTRFDQMMLQTSGLREEYHLTPNDGNVQSDVVLLNGSPLELTCDGDIPDLVPEIVDGSLPIQMAPSSIAFVNIKDFQAPACA